MAILPSQAEYIARICNENNINGSVITMGRTDVFVTLPELTTILKNLGIVYEDHEGLEFKDINRGKKANELIKANKHLRKSCGNQRVIGEYAITDEFFFNSLGFDIIQCIDLNPNAGRPTIVFDMNERDILQATNNMKYDAVIDTGVMEHVFDIRSFLLNCTDLAKDNGHLIHVMISNNTMDHGFYQFSPTLFKD